jgi:hypothetical protein
MQSTTALKIDLNRPNANAVATNHVDHEKVAYQNHIASKSILTRSSQLLIIKILSWVYPPTPSRLYLRDRPSASTVISTAMLALVLRRKELRTKSKK